MNFEKLKKHPNCYYSNENGILFCANCLDIMPELEGIDYILTDPPYGLRFMGKTWDYNVPSIEMFKLMLDAVKPGATMFCFAGSRTQHRMAVNIEDAGWILKDCVMWIYGSGFPKATDISKKIDQKAGIEREIIGKNPNARKSSGNINICKKNGSGAITTPSTSEAQLWNGWKSHGLKPAYEPILVCMKPNEGSYADNALKHGVAGLNIDGGRIKSKDGVPKFTHRQEKTQNCYGDGKNGSNRTGEIDTITGRYPANIIFDEGSSALLDEQSGECTSGGGFKGTQNHTTCFSGFNGNSPNPSTGGDTVGASRFFYCAKSSQSERNAGCEGLERKKVSDGRKIEADNAYQRGKTMRSNTHPTVKPLKLMKYLLTLLKTPTGGTCIDCFAGSGSTLLACESMGLKWIGVEQNSEYCDIIVQRVENERKQLKLF